MRHRHQQRGEAAPPNARPVVIRPARASEEAHVARLFFGSPSRENSALAGSAERATALGKAWFSTGVGRDGCDEIFVAASGQRVVGALLARTDGTGFPVSVGLLSGLMTATLRSYDPCELPMLLCRVLPRAALEFPVPSGSYYILELHVDPRERGRGIGTCLIEHAIERAAKAGYASINLATESTNPARRLYQRLGFSVVEDRTDALYEMVTGTPGRIFMQRSLG